MSTKSENHEHDDTSGGFPKVKHKSYQSQMKQNNSTELSGLSSIKIYIKNCTPELPDPNPGFSGFSSKFQHGGMTKPLLSGQMCRYFGVIFACLSPPRGSIGLTRQTGTHELQRSDEAYVLVQKFLRNLSAGRTTQRTLPRLVPLLFGLWLFFELL